MALPYPSKVFTPFDQLPASDLNEMVANDEALAAGTGIAVNAITGDKLSISAITLGYAQITTSFSTSSGTPVQVTGLSVTVTVPSGGRRIEISTHSFSAYQTGTGGAFEISIWDGAVGTGTLLSKSRMNNTANISSTAIGLATSIPVSGSKTYNIGIQSGSGTANLEAASTSPAFILVKLI